MNQLTAPNVITAIAALAFALSTCAAQETVRADGNFYEKSLHYTNRGLEYWYAAERGGLERITGVPFSQLTCTKCHVRSCDTCHLKTVAGKISYSNEPARAQEACIKCHGLEPLQYAQKNPNAADADVHFKRGFKCMECHSVREIHGDGTLYDSFQSPGAMDTTCEKCHTDLSKCTGHAVHNGRVDCGACHVRDLPSCYNCHFGMRIKEGKSVSLPLKNMLFLVNHDGKVTTASLHTFVYENRTMAVFGPAFPHNVMKEGRGCPDCHDTGILRDIARGKFTPVVWENGTVKNTSGVIPVLDGLDWNFVFLDHKDGKWLPMEKPARPLINYSGFSSPITRAQFGKLLKPQGHAKSRD